MIYKSPNPPSTRMEGNHPPMHFCNNHRAWQRQDLSPSFSANEKRIRQPPDQGIRCTLIGDSSVHGRMGLRSCAPLQWIQADRRPNKLMPGSVARSLTGLGALVRLHFRLRVDQLDLITVSTAHCRVDDVPEERSAVVHALRDVPSVVDLGTCYSTADGSLRIYCTTYCSCVGRGE